jgi:methionyl-tRNA formyltransferase
MRIVILSTDTKHHRYFIHKLAERFDVTAVFYERKRLIKDYPTGPFFTAEENLYEERFFDPTLGGVPREYPRDLAQKVVEIHSVNQQGVAEYMAALAPDLGVVFGTGPLKPHIFTVPGWGCVNVHRGIPQIHCGLDSDLWSILENRFDCIGVTLHLVEQDLDTGAILAQETTPIERDDEIFHLRYKTTLQATRMMLALLTRFKAAGGPIPGEPQKTRGRYLTAMPLEQKQEALGNFLTYREGLRG